MTTDETARMAAATALKKMFRDGHFSICTLDEIIKRFSVTPQKDAYGTLRLLHCVNYSDMPQELRQELPSLIATCLQGLDIDTVAVEQLLPRPPKPPAPPAAEKDITPQPKARLLGFLRKVP